MDGKVFEVGTDISEIIPQPDTEQVQGIVFAAYAEAIDRSPEERQEIGHYMAKLAKSLLENKKG